MFSRLTARAFVYTNRTLGPIRALQVGARTVATPNVPAAGLYTSLSRSFASTPQAFEPTATGTGSSKNAAATKKPSSAKSGAGTKAPATPRKAAVKKPTKKKAVKKVAKKKVVKKKVLAKKTTVKKKPELLYTPPPKRPGSSFVLYGLDRGIKSITALAAEWKNVPDTEKQVYEQKFKDALITYHEELAKWEHAQSPEAISQFKRLRKARSRLRRQKRELKYGTEGLKRPATAYIQFNTEVQGDPAKFGLQTELEEFVASQPAGKKAPRCLWISKKAGELWRSMTLGEKAPYVARFQENMKQYEVERAQAIAAKLAEKTKV